MKQSLLTLFLLATLPSVAQTANPSTNASSTQTTPTVKEYVGTYSFADGSPLGKFTITEKDGEIYGEADSYGSNKLIKQAQADTYQSTSSYSSIIVFTRDATTKAVTGLILRLQGQEASAKKEVRE